MKTVGLILAVVGIAGGMYALNLETSVVSGGQTIESGSYSMHVPEMRVNNIGLMDQRRNYLYASGVAILVGVILFGFGSIQSAQVGVVTDTTATLKLIVLWGLVGIPLLWGVAKTLENAMKLFK